MNTIKALVPYQTETFRSYPVHPSVPAGDREPESQPAAQRPETARLFARPARSTPFLVQLMVSTDSDLRKNLGRQEIVQAREMAYGTALSNRPSASGLRFVQSLGKV